MEMPFARGSPPPEPLPGVGPARAVKLPPPDILTRIAEEVWRLSRRVDRGSATLGEEALKGIRDSVTRLKDLLNSAGICIEDYIGKPYDEGLRLDVVHVDGDVAQDQPLWIVETVKPTVLLDGRVMNTGQVILGTHPPEVTNV